MLAQLPNPFGIIRTRPGVEYTQSHMAGVLMPLRQQVQAFLQLFARNPLLDSLHYFWGDIVFQKVHLFPQVVLARFGQMTRDGSLAKAERSRDLRLLPALARKQGCRQHIQCRVLGSWSLHSVTPPN